MSKKKKEQQTDSVPETTQTKEVVETDTSQVVEEPQPAEPKQDTIDPLSVALTVLVFCSEESGNLLRYTLRSLHHLRGITAEVKVTGRNKPIWLRHEDFIGGGEANDSKAVIILNALEGIKTERVILMDDHTMLLNPVSMADIAILKANPDAVSDKVTAILRNEYGLERIENYDTRTPLYAFRSQLKTLLTFAIDRLKDVDIPTLYNNFMFKDLKPLLLNWRRDDWLLPVISAKPQKEVVMQYAKNKKFMYVATCNPHILDILQTIYPNPCECEDDHRT
jgi:hypothetical protein